MRLLRLALFSATTSVHVLAWSQPRRDEAPVERAAPTQPKLTKPPALARFVEPHYPEDAHASGRTAEVLLSLELDAAGRVAKATVISPPNPGFDEAALEAGRQLEFTPAEVDGAPAPVRITYRYRFTLRPASEERQPEPAVPPVLKGRVSFEGGASPAAGVRLSIPSLKLETRTDAQGAFSFGELAPGVYLVHLSGAGIVPTVVEQGVPTAEADGATYEVVLQETSSAIDEEIVIRTRHLGQRAGSSAVDTDRARQVPGVMGDALNVVQSLPGVASSPAGSGALVVWGAAPAETRVFIDDVPVPALYHQGGFRAVIHDGLVSSVELVPAGFGPEYGRAVGGIVLVDTAPLSDSGAHGELGADFIGASAMLSFRPSSSAVVAGAGRVGYLEQVLSAVSDDVEQVVPISAYRDYAAKARLDSSPEHTTELMVFGSFDDVERRLPSTDSNITHAEHNRETFHRAALQHRGSPRRGIVDRATLWLGLDDSELRANFGDVSTRLQSRAYRFGGRASRQFEIVQQHALTLGLDVEGAHTDVERTGTLGLPAREGDTIAFGQAPAGQVAADEWSVQSLALAGYVRSDWRLAGGLLELSPGVRVEPVVQSGDRALPTTGGGPAIGYSKFDLAVGPRLSAKLHARDDLEVRAATGIYQQPPPPVDLSPVFGGTKLGLTQAAHALIGVVHRPWPTGEVELAGFDKYTWDIVTRSRAQPPPVAAALANQGSGRSYGAQLVLRQEPWRKLSGWVSYSLTRSERRDHDGAAWRLSDFDQSHQFTAVASYELSPSFSFGTRLRAASGLPRSQVIGAYYDARLDRFQPLFGQHNGIRLPASFQLDLHAEYRHVWDGARLSAYLDALNVTNQRNPIELVYSDDYSQSSYLSSLPTLIVMGGRVEF